MMASESPQVKVSKNTPPDILYQTFCELQQREEKLKDHLRSECWKTQVEDDVLNL